MQLTNPTLLLTLILMVSLDGCQPKNVDMQDPIQIAVDEQINNVADCNFLVNFDFMKTLDNQEGIVEEYVTPTNGPIKRKWFRVFYEDVPTHYLKPCNLPDEFKQLGLRIRFSGSVYQPKNMALVQISSVPAVFTQVQKVSVND